VKKYKNYIIVWAKTNDFPRSKSFTSCTEEYFKKTYIPLIPREIEGFYQYETESEARDMFRFIRT